MNIEYASDKNYTQEQSKDLFQSVNWLSGNYPERLLKALDNSETVFTAWNDEKLVGLVNVIDDGELTAYIHYLLVNPEYQGYGIGRELLRKIKKKYSHYLYLILIAENEALVDYYKRLDSQKFINFKKPANPLYYQGIPASPE